MTGRAILLLAVAIGLHACDRPPEESPHDADRPVAGIAVSAEPLLDIPATLPGGAAAYGYASDATRLPDGHVVVADGYASSVQYFDSTGALVRTVGRFGQGPGEFAGPTWVEKCSADSVFVWDGARATVSVLDAEGQIVRSYDVRPDIYELACSRSGGFLAIGAPMVHGPMSEEGERVSSDVWLLDASGRETASLGTIVYAEFRPLGRRTRFAIDDRHVYLGVEAAPGIDVYDYTGERLASIESGAVERVPRPSHYDRAIEEMLVQVDEPMREPSREMLHRIPMPETLPAYSDMFTDPDGRLWLVTSALGDGFTRLRAVGPDGKVIGEATIPLDLKVFEVGAGYVLGMHEDEGGEQRVLVFGLER